MVTLLFDALRETMFMVGAASLLAGLFGLLLGYGLYRTRIRNRWIGKTVRLGLNLTDSLPFAILMIVLIPFTKWILGTSLGTLAAVIPLAVGAIPFAAAVTEEAFARVDPLLIEAVLLMGASEGKIFRKVLIPESLSSLVTGFTSLTVRITGYSAMAGLIGGGGLGQVALRYGYQRFNTEILLFSAVLLLFLVQSLQTIGRFLAKKVSHEENS